MSVSDVSTAATATKRGTVIVSSGNNGLDRNAFLKILTTELSNQDPSTPTDSTQYVAQLAQFSSLEQMQNLNDTMTFNGATSLIGKNVNLNIVDSDNYLISGQVKGVFKNSNGVFVHLQVTATNGTTSIEDYPYSNVAEVASVDQMQNLNDTIAFNGANGLIGKNVNLNLVDANNVQVTGLVKGAFKDANGVFIHLQITNADKTTSIKDFPYDNVEEIIS
jgi:flagellar basal-body rod modification protein FlgD